MKLNRKNILIALAAVILLVCACIGIIHSTKPDTSSGRNETVLDAVSVYVDAVNSAKALSNYTVNSGYSQSSVINNEVFSFESSQNLMVYGHGSKKMNALGSETLTVGGQRVDFEYSYVNGIAYMVADSKQFHAPTSPDGFLTGRTPAVLLEPALYKNITVSKDESSYTVCFSGANAPEKWAGPENAKLVSAAGTAVLDKDLRLTQSSYAITYILNGIPTKIVAVSSIEYAAKAFTVPVRADSVFVESLESIRLLEIACGYMVQANTVLSKINENIICQAYGDSREQFTRINMNAAGTNCIANIRINTTLSNSGKTEADLQKKQVIQYKNGQYQQSIDDGAPVQETGVTPHMMKTYCQDYFLSTMIQSKYITGVTASENPSTYRFEYNASDAFAHQLCQSASQILYQDSTLLFNVSDDFSIESTSAFLEIEKHTGLPVSSGISCSVSHTVGGFPYQLQYSIQQEYDVPSAAAARLK